MASFLLSQDGFLRIVDATSGRVADLGTGSGFAPVVPYTVIAGDLTFARTGNVLHALDRTTGALRTVTEMAEFGSLAGNTGPGRLVAYGDGHLVAGASNLLRLDPDGTLVQIAGEFPEGPDFLPLRDVADMTVFADRVFFVASEAGTLSRSELFVTYGTAAGTQLPRDFYPGTTAQTGAVDLDADWMLIATEI